MGFIDLHTHTAASDGTDAPAQLIARAAQLNLEAIAITDHDTLAGLSEAQKAAHEKGITLVRGCEISTTSPLGDFHILGLWVPDQSPALENFLRDAAERRERRNQIMVSKLRSLGMDISLDELHKKAGGMPGRPHMAAIMLEKGYVRNHGEAFRDYLGKTGKAYAPKLSPAPEYAVRVLAQAGATAVLAHPLLQSPPPEELEAFIKKLSRAGLSALEVWHSSHTYNQTEYLRKLAKKLGLGMTGGSDYHGLAKPGIELGSGYGNLRLKPKLLDNLIAMRQARGLPC